MNEKRPMIIGANRERSWSMNAASVTMMQTTMDIPVSKRFFPGLLPIIGDEAYEQVIARYRELYSNQGLPADPRLRWHLVEGILPGLALYQILKESGESQDDALGRIDRAFDQLFAGDVRQMKRIGRLPFALRFFRVFLKSFMRRYPPEGWTIEWRQNSRDGIRFDMTTCFYHATLSNLGAPELTAAFCRVDDLIYGTMSRYVSWQRTTTIASGSACCDFCFASTRQSRQGTEWSS
jgi:hypothetical protein